MLKYQCCLEPGIFKPDNDESTLRKSMRITEASNLMGLIFKNMVTTLICEKEIDMIFCSRSFWLIHANKCRTELIKIKCSCKSNDSHFLKK